VWGPVQAFITAYGLPAGTETDDERNTLLHHLTAPSAPPDLLYDRVGELTKDALTARNEKGQTPFHRALAAKNWPLCERMLETGRLDLHQGQDALHWELLLAIQVDAPHSLLEKLAAALGARLAEPDGDGWTVLHHVAASNHVKWAESLARAARLDDLWRIPDREGRRPVDLCGTGIAQLAPADVRATPWPEPIAWDQAVNWGLVPKDEALAFITRANLQDVGATAWEMARGVLAFYPGKTLARLTRPGNGATRPAYYFLENGDEFSRLDGTSPPIHAFNAAHLKLTRDYLRSYLHFFCFFVRGEEGPFLILEDATRVTLSTAATKDDRLKLASAAMPVWLIGEHDQDFRMLARVFYGKAVFTAYFKLFKTGMIEMEDDNPLVDDLSGGIDMPLA
jgi:hypothetical protein